MAYDEGLAQIMRDHLAGERIEEKKMFGGLAFLLNGHMVCGVHKDGAMFRLNKATYDTALTIPGVSAMYMSGDKVMASMVDVSDEVLADDARRGQLMGMALSVVQALPPKVAKPKKG